MAQLRLENVTCAYGSIEALKDATIEIQPGDFVGIIGPNGSGKSTLLKALSRALKPARGTVFLDGDEIWSRSIRDIAKQMAVVPQETEVCFDFSVREVVLMGRTPHMGRFQVEGESEREVARRAMDQTRITDLAERPITALSGGERQRAIIARALAQEPRILLLDEPTSHLDINFQVEILDLIRSLNRDKGITVLAVLHDLSLAAQFCDKLVLLKDGAILEMGAPAAVITTQRIRQVYGTDVIVRRHPVTGRPYVISGSRPPKRGGGVLARIHLICGGGSGADLMHRLTAEGCEVSVGVLNVDDSDEETARQLGLLVVAEAPFSPISDATHQRNAKLAREADAVVIAQTPFGHGNLLNLDAVMDALESGKPVVIVGKEFGERDFANGEATRKLNALVEKGARTVSSIEEACGLVRTLVVSVQS